MRKGLIIIAAAFFIELSARSAAQPISDAPDMVERLIEIARYDDLFDESEVLRSLEEKLVPTPNPGRFPWVAYEGASETKLARAHFRYLVVNKIDRPFSPHASLIFGNLAEIACDERENLTRRLNELFPRAPIIDHYGEFWTVPNRTGKYTYVYVAYAKTENGCATELVIKMLERESK